MTDLRASKMEVIQKCLWDLCRTNHLHPSPYEIDLKATVLMEKLEEIDSEEQARLNELTIINQCQDYEGICHD